MFNAFPYGDVKQREKGAFRGYIRTGIPGPAGKHNPGEQGRRLYLS